MIALEVSSAARPQPSYGSISRVIRSILTELLRVDPDTRYLLCHRVSRLRRGTLVRMEAPNARVRITQDPFNALLIPRARLFHSMGVFTPTTPRIPKLVTIHDLNVIRNEQWNRSSWTKKRGEKIRSCVRRADHVVTYSRFTAEEVAGEFGVPEERVHAVHLGVDSTAFHPAEPETQRRLRERFGDYAVVVAQYLPRKNLVRLVEALEPLKDLRLVVVASGGAGQADFDATVERLGMGGRIVRRSRLVSEEMTAVVGSARLFVMPSLYEGFGLPALEAMACGTPVVCSRAASLPEVVGDAAWLVDAADTDALREGIRRVHEDESLAADLRRRGLARAHEMTWRATAGKLRALYRQIGGV